MFRFVIERLDGINVGGVWSPHGRVMAATLSSEGGNPDIYLMGDTALPRIIDPTSRPLT